MASTSRAPGKNRTTVAKPGRAGGATGSVSAQLPDVETSVSTPRPRKAQADPPDAARIRIPFERRGRCPSRGPGITLVRRRRGPSTCFTKSPRCVDGRRHAPSAISPAPRRQHQQWLGSPLPRGISVHGAPARALTVICSPTHRWRRSSPSAASSRRSRALRCRAGTRPTTGRRDAPESLGWLEQRLGASRIHVSHSEA